MIAARWPERVGRACRVGLALVLPLTALAFGGVHRWAGALLEIAVWALALTWFATRRLAAASGRARGADLGWRFAGAALALVAYLAFQLVPLSRATLEVLSPAAADLYGNTVDTVASIPAPLGAIKPVGLVEDAQVSPAARMEIAELLMSHEVAPPGGPRPLALDPFAAWSDLLRYLAYGLLLWLAATLPQPARLLRAVFAAGVLIAALGIVEFVTCNGYVLWFFTPFEGGPISCERMFGPFVDPDHFGAFLEMVVPCGAALIALRWRRAEEDSGLQVVWVGFGLAVVVAAIIGSASRGAVVGSALGGLVFWWGRQRGRDDGRRASGDGGWASANGRWARVAPLLLAVVVVGAGLLYAGPRARQTMGERIEKSILAPDLDFRLMMVRQSLPILADFPWFGIGAGGWGGLMSRYQRYPLLDYRHVNMHNDYVEWAAEVGAAGLLLTVILGWSYLRQARRNATIPSAVSWGILGAVTAIAFHETLDFPLRMPANAALLAVLLGLRCNPYWERGESDVTGRGERSFAPTPEDSRSGVSNGNPALRPAARWLRLLAVLLAVPVAVGLGAASVQQWREFRQWQRVRLGDVDLDFAPSDAETWLAAGERMLAAGLRYEPPTAGVWQATAQLRPAGGDAYWYIGLSAPRFEDKLRALQAALYLNPTSAVWRRVYATHLAALGRQDEALMQVERAAYLDPRVNSHPEITAAAAPELEAAVERGVLRALAERPDDPAVLAEAAKFYDRVHRSAEAAALWVQAADRDDRWAEAGRNAAASYAQAGDYEHATQCAERAIDAAPEQPEGYRVLALSVFAPQERWDDAVQTLKRGIKRSGDPSALYRTLSELQRQRGDVDASLDALARAAALHPRDAGLQSQLGSAYLGAGQVLRAKLAFEAALKIDSRSAGNHYAKGVAMERLYDLAGARDEYRKAATLEPDNPGYAKAAQDIEARIKAAGAK